AHLDSALARSLGLNPSLVLEILDGIVGLWSLACWRDSATGETARHALASAAEAVTEMEDSGWLARFPEQFPEVPDLGAYWNAQMALEAFRLGYVDADSLATLRKEFERLSGGEGPVVRSLARPYRGAVDYREDDGGVALNGLFLGAGDGF